MLNSSDNPLEKINNTKSRLLSKAMKLLAKREHSVFELRKKLSSQSNESSSQQQIIDSIIDQLISENWQSDLRFAQAFTRSKIRKGFGPIAIKYELSQHQIDHQIIIDVLIKAQHDWKAIAKNTFEKKFMPLGNRLSDDFNDSDSKLSNKEPLEKSQQQLWKEKAKQLRFMQQRGFSSEHYQHFL